jgi:alkaline phosphatase
MKVGILSTVSLDDATPAVFYAHVPERGRSYDIAVALSGSGFDFFGGGGLRDPDNARTKSPDFLGNAFDLMRERGYETVMDNARFRSLRPGAGKIVAVHQRLQGRAAVPYTLDSRDEDISLADYTSKAVSLMEGADGFFLMVEAGKIDWACHANDAATAVHDILALDEAVARAREFYSLHPDDTLIVVTADHETGGLALGHSGYETRLDLLGRQTVSFQQFFDSVVVPLGEGGASFEAAKVHITTAFGLRFQGQEGDPLVLTPDEQEQVREAFHRSMASGKGSRKGEKDPATKLLYGREDPLTLTLTRLLNQKAGIGWTSLAHTGIPVATSAVGAGSGSFAGRYDNTRVAGFLLDAMGIPSDR